MVVILLLVGVCVIGVTTAAALGRVRGGLDPAPVNRADNRLPDGPVRPPDLADLSFTVALRGYRMDEVDAVLDRLTRELAERDHQLARLRSRALPTAQPGPSAQPGGSAGPDLVKKPRL